MHSCVTSPSWQPNETGPDKRKNTNMTRTALFVATLLCSLLFTTMSWGFSLRERALIKNQKSYLKRGAIRTYKRYCGPLQFKVNWASFRGQIQRRLNRQKAMMPYSYCEVPLRSLYHLCRQGARAAIKQQIQSYTCSYHDKARGTMTLVNGHLRYWVSRDNRNLGKKASVMVGTLLKAADGDGKGFSVRESQFIKGQMKYFRRGNIRTYRRYCKRDLPTFIDWKSFRSQIQLRFQRKLFRSPYSDCDAPIATLYDLCRSGYRRTVVRKIKRYVCKYGGRARVRLRKGTLTYWVNWRKRNVHVFLKRVISSKL